MNDTPQAFPALERGGGGLELSDPGMSLRDYFAAKAMHALVTEPPWGDGGSATVHSWSKDFHGGDSIARFAYAAYKMADAMLEARGTPRTSS